MTMQGNQWVLSSSHGTLLFHIAANPDCTINEIADAMVLTKRSVWGVIGDLRRAGMLHTRKQGRRHYYTVNLDAPFLHPTLKGYTLRHALGGIIGQARRCEAAVSSWHAPVDASPQLSLHSAPLSRALSPSATI